MGRPGETVATYTLNYGGGKTQEIPMRNGIEVARANIVYGCTRIDPVATAAQPALSLRQGLGAGAISGSPVFLPVAGGRVESLTAQPGGNSRPCSSLHYAEQS